MARKFFIETFGCQMNVLDSEKIAGNLLQNGLESVEDSAQADVIILNTCSVREKAVQKVYARLGEFKRARRENPDLVLGVVGCMAQLEGEAVLAKAPHVNLLAGPQKGGVIADLVHEAAITGAAAISMRMDEDPEPMEVAFILRENRWRASVTISEGCSRRCSFCVVPFTRGKQRDRESGKIIREVEELVAEGYIEIVLLGQTVNSYRDPSPAGNSFPDLVRRLAAIRGLERIRFTSPHPDDFSDDLLNVMESCPKVCNHIHLPVQSGSSRILRAMRRGYSRRRYLETVRKIQRAAREIAISTDIIVGFPGEREEDFRDTLSLLDEARYDSLYSFKYSPRPTTTAASLPDDVPEEVKSRRLSLLQEQQKLIQYNKNAAYVGRALEVLVEEPARNRFSLSGRAGNNKIVNFNGPKYLLGKLITVDITDFSANSLKGALASGPQE